MEWPGSSALVLRLQRLECIIVCHVSHMQLHCLHRIDKITVVYKRLV